MRTARIVEEGAAYYHITSRVVDRRYVFDDAEKERVHKTMRAVEGFIRIPESVPGSPKSSLQQKRD